jgi:hypothetical protein
LNRPFKKDKPPGAQGSESDECRGEKNMVTTPRFVQRNPLFLKKPKTIITSFNERAWPSFQYNSNGPRANPSLFRTLKLLGIALRRVFNRAKNLMAVIKENIANRLLQPLPHGLGKIVEILGHNAWDLLADELLIP